jgi:hypothetical protein
MKMAELSDGDRLHRVLAAAAAEIRPPDRPPIEALERRFRQRRHRKVAIASLLPLGMAAALAISFNLSGSSGSSDSPFQIPVASNATTGAATNSNISNLANELTTINDQLNRVDAQISAVKSGLAVTEGDTSQ